MSRGNHPWNVSVQMQSCIRPRDAGSLCPAGPDAICASPPEQPAACTASTNTRVWGSGSDRLHHHGWDAPRIVWKVPPSLGPRLFRLPPALRCTPGRSWAAPRQSAHFYSRGPRPPCACRDGPWGLWATCCGAPSCVSASAASRVRHGRRGSGGTRPRVYWRCVHNALFSSKLSDSCAAVFSGIVNLT